MATHKFGRLFELGGLSDLDLFIVNRSLFEKMEREARLFVAQAGDRYRDQTATVERQLGRSYLDLKQVPAMHHAYPAISTGLNDASILVQRLALHGLNVQKSYFRIYGDWQALAKWVERSYLPIWRRSISDANHHLP
jgi:hypothetical protein